MQKLNIMVVDDSLLTIKKMTKILEDLGHRVVHIAKTGLEAVNAYKYVKPDLVTMDITMPDMDGIEATQKIIEKYEDALIIMVTSHGQEQMVIQAIQAGALGYVIKPFKKEKLDEQITKLISNYL